jgi:hypothetical protein
MSFALRLDNNISRIYLVPIYDASGVGLDFGSSSLADITALPLWKKGKHEALPGSLVTAAFAAGSFESSSGGTGGMKTLALMPNLLFVIVLGVGTVDS